MRKKAKFSIYLLIVFFITSAIIREIYFQFFSIVDFIFSLLLLILGISYSFYTFSLSSEDSHEESTDAGSKSD